MRILLGISILILGGSVLAQAQRGRDLSTDARSLADTQWRLVSFGKVGADTDVTGSQDVTLKFGSDGRASGSGGCNSYSGTYRVRGDSVTFGPLISTKRACLDSTANRQEQQFLDALGAATRFRVTRDSLSITYDSGRSVLTFVDQNRSDGNSGDSGGDDPISVLATYYRLLNSKDYQRAYRFWESPTQSYDQFVRGFADTERVRFFFEPPDRLDGAAGSVFAEIPTVLIAYRNRGGDRTFTGCYVLRRSNVSDNRGWRIYRATLSTATRLTAPNCQN